MSSKKAPELVVKDPKENRRVHFNFEKDLQTGESLEGTPLFSVTPDDEILEIDQVSVSGTFAEVMYKSGVKERKYEVECTVSATGGQIYVGRHDLLVI